MTLKDPNWEEFGKEGPYLEVTCESRDGIIASVLETFGIPHAIHKDTTLDGIDIKRMDAMQVINLALLELLAETGIVYELSVNEDGEAVLIEIGEGSSNMSDIYYDIQTVEYRDSCTGVLIRGGQPTPYWLPLEWKNIWGEGLHKYIFDTTEMTTNCMLQDFSTHATIVFPNPHLESEFNDGINNLYEIDDPAKKIIGYARRIIVPPELMTNKTKINYSNDSVVPILVGQGQNVSMGTLVSRPLINAEALVDAETCWAWVDFRQEVDYEQGIKIPIPDALRFEDIRGTEVDNYVKVEDVMLKGKELTMMKAGFIDGDYAAANYDPSDSNTIAFITIENMSNNLFKLERGKHYTIAHDEDNNPYIVFAKDARVNEPKKYGENTKYKISMYGESGVLHAGEEGVATIFPLAENRGIMVTEIWATASLSTPSISVFDPEFNDEENITKAITIAEELEYKITPLMMYEAPAPIVYNGDLLDQTEGVKDADPTTVQDFKTTALEQVMNELAIGGGGLELTLPFLNKEDDVDKLKRLSSALYDHMNHSGVETTHICGPNCGDLILGKEGTGGGVVNSITYSYTDSGSYTISVNEGSYILSNNLNGGGAEGPTIKATENFSARGTIIDSVGNGIHFKVRIDGYGERIAINTCPSILRVGDVVSCSIHNNPVEI